MIWKKLKSASRASWQFGTQPGTPNDEPEKIAVDSQRVDQPEKVAEQPGKSHWRASKSLDESGQAANELEKLDVELGKIAVVPLKVDQPEKVPEEQWIDEWKKVLGEL